VRHVFPAALALGLAVPAGAATVAVQAGNWVRLFTRDIENVLGYAVHVDTASIAPGGLGRSFREAEVMLAAHGGYPSGSTLTLQRSVDCAGSRAMTAAWQVTGPTGRALGTSTTPGAVSRVAWESPDGKVLRYVCTGVLPR